MKHFILPAVIATIFIAFTPTQLTNADSKIRVQVDISNRDSSQEFINTKVESYIKRKLRKLGDIEIVDNTPVYVVKGVAIELKTGRYVTGYAVTITTLWRRDLTMWGINLPYDVYTYLQSLITVGSDLEQMCHDFVINIDSRELEAHRQADRLIKEADERFWKNTR